MSTLAGKTLLSTYTSLLKLEGDTQTLVAGGGTAIQIKTGDNEVTPIYLNTNRVGIGTATPGDTLEITGGDSTGVLISSNGVGSNNSYIVFKTDADGTPRRGQIPIQLKWCMVTVSIRPIIYVLTLLAMLVLGLLHQLAVPVLMMGLYCI